MQAAFVEIGLERTGFLHADDIVIDTGNGQVRSCDLPDENGDKQPIAALVREGQSVVVQVVKDPIGSKGARLTTQIAIPSRNLVYLPGTDHVGVSQRIVDPDERERLKQAVRDSREQLAIAGGFIVRTAGESADKDDMLQDMQFLKRVWERA